MFIASKKSSVLGSHEQLIYMGFGITKKKVTIMGADLWLLLSSFRYENRIYAPIKIISNGGYLFRKFGDKKNYGIHN